MSFHRSHIGGLPSAIGDKLARRIGDSRLAVFLDYDGTLTPIVDRPQVISPRMREVVTRLAERCPGCVVSGRDRRVDQELMGVHDLVVAGSHGFDIVAEPRRAEVERVVERLLTEHETELKVTPGKLVYEIQPKLDCDKGRAVLHLLTVLGLDGDGVVPIYVGDDDITDGHAFEASWGRGIGVIVAAPGDREVAGRATAAELALDSVEEVERCLDGLAR